MRKIDPMRFTAVLAFAMVACAASGTKLIQTHVEEKRMGKPIKDVLIIAIVDDREIRAIFEKHFMAWTSPTLLSSSTGSI